MQTENVAQPVEQQRCQWCGNAIPAAASHCPECGAATVNPALSAEDITQSSVPDAPIGDPAQAFLNRLEQQTFDNRPTHPTRQTSAGPEAILIYVIAAIAGGAAGMVLGPPLLSFLFGSFLDLTVDGVNSFRQLGAFFGVLAGLLIASVIGIFRPH